MNVVTISPTAGYEHIGVRLPLLATSGAKTYDVPEWSASGFRVNGFDVGGAAGNVMPFKLLLPFDAFDLVLTINAKVLRTNPSAKSADMAFLGLTKRQSDLLQYVSDAYLSEELVSTGDLIEVVAKTPKSAEMPTAAQSSSSSRKVGRAFGKILSALALAAVAAGLLAYLVSSAYQRIFVISAVSGLVAIESSAIASPVAGVAVVTAKGDALKVGDPVAEVTALSGEVVKIASPCNCTVPAESRSGAMPIAAGGRILSLYHDGSAPMVNAFVRYEDLLRLYRGASIKLFFADGSVSSDAAIGSLPSLSPENLPDGALVEIDVKPGAELKRELIGQPVFVQFDTGPL
jgi:mannuronan synthase